MKVNKCVCGFDNTKSAIINIEDEDGDYTLIWWVCPDCQRHQEQWIVIDDNDKHRCPQCGGDEREGSHGVLVNPMSYGQPPDYTCYPEPDLDSAYDSMRDDIEF